MHRATTLAAALAVLLSLAASTHAAQYGDLTLTFSGQTYTFLDYSHDNARSNAAGNRDTRGRLYVPDNYDPTKSYGVVVMLHGDGEAGTDNREQVEARTSGIYNGQVHGSLRNLAKNAKDRGYLLYVPQSPGTFWGDEQMYMTTGTLARIASEYNVDPSRFYLTGLSKGGTGVHNGMSNFSDLYAAYAPLSTANSSSLDVQKAKGLPAWYFHARDDTTVGVGTSRGAVSALTQAQGGTAPSYPPLSSTQLFEFSYGSVKYTEYATGGHGQGVWNNGAYNDPRLYEWMLSKQTGFATLQQGRSVAVNFFNHPSISGATTFNLRGADTDGRQWNNIAKVGMDNTLDYVVGYAEDTGGAQTTTSIELTAAFDGVGTDVANNITAFGADAWIAGRYWRTKTNQAGAFTFTGLTPGGMYDLAVFASIAQAGFVGLYSAAGVTDTLDASFNTDEFAMLQGIVADSAGAFTLTVAPTAGSTRAVLNAFTLTAVPEPAATALLTLATLGLLPRRRANCR